MSESDPIRLERDDNVYVATLDDPPLGLFRQRTFEQIAEIRDEVNASDARAFVWRGSGPDMGVSSQRNPIHMAIAVWEWGAYYGDAKMKGAKLDIAKWKRPSPETIPSEA